jgi:hypothetical protein
MQDDNRWRAERRMMIACAMVTGALPTSAAAQTTQGGVDALPAITVEERPEVYREPETTLGGKFEAELMRIPQGVQVVNDKVIRDQGAVDIGDILRNIPSANVGNTRLAPFASFSWTLRGFDAGVNRNGFRQLYFEDVDQSALWNIERIDVIKGLDPAPGRKMTEEKTTYVVPDIVVAKEGDDWTIVLNDEGLPRLRISGFYRQLLAKAGQGDPEAYRFLKDRLKKALWFMRSLDQRNQTIHKVARFIVDRQKDFFEKGIDYIKPLTLMEIAQDIGVHESTVGRVVANKYMMTPRGVFSLKYFFHKSLPGTYGEDVSSLKVKDRIRKLVDAEDRDRPLSDIEIGELLAREDLRIDRRTVA